LIFKDIENQRKIQSGKNGGKSRALSNTNINITKKRGEIIPKIYRFSTNKIVLEEGRNLEIKTSFFQY